MEVQVIKLHGSLKVGRFLGIAVAGFALATSAATGAESPYKALYVFGDSFSDTGARYLDGKDPTPVALLAQRMGIPFTHSKDPMPEGKSINFAATAAGTGDDKGTGEWCCQGMLNQVEDFAARVRSGKVKFKPESTLFFLEGGLNDTDVDTAVTLGNLTRQIEILRGLGARHFTLTQLPTRIPDFAAVGKRLNPAYEMFVSDLQMKGVDIHLNRWGAYLDEIIENPAKYGIVNTTSQCAGRALFKEDATPCATPDKYFYFHSGHPSGAVNRMVVDKLYPELVASRNKSGDGMMPNAMTN